MSYNFILVGAAGYIAPRHMRAIKETGNNIVAIMDPNDSIGIIDSFYNEAKYFNNIQDIKSYLDILKYKIDYISICSPNHTHLNYIKFGAEENIKIICEKPLVRTLKELKQVKKIQYNNRVEVNTILQLRLHPKIVDLKRYVENSNKLYNVSLQYITGRGHWYDMSWKGKEALSGGLIMNIGIHLFDMLQWVFGDMIDCETYSKERTYADGSIRFKRATVEWFLSRQFKDLPKYNNMTYRSMKIDGKEIDFTNGFDNLHTKSYKEILSGNGFDIEDAEASIKIIDKINNEKTISKKTKIYLSST